MLTIRNYFCSLLEVLSDHLNAEIVAGTIGSKQDAMDYITWTYFFRRLVMNPRWVTNMSVVLCMRKHLTLYIDRLVQERCNSIANALELYLSCTKHQYNVSVVCDCCCIFQIIQWCIIQYLTHWGGDRMDAISQTTFGSAFSWMKMFEFRLKFHWSLFLRVQLTIFQHWFR